MAVSAAHAALAAGWRVDAALAAGPRRSPSRRPSASPTRSSSSPRSPLVGALLLLATATAPAAALAGVSSVLLALATASALGLPPEQRRSGQLSYNALMVGLALSALTPPSPFALGVLVVAVVASVLVTAALHSRSAAGHGCRPHAAPSSRSSTSPSEPSLRAPPPSRSPRAASSPRTSRRWDRSSARLGSTPGSWCWPRCCSTAASPRRSRSRSSPSPSISRPRWPLARAQRDAGRDGPRRAWFIPDRPLRDRPRELSGLRRPGPRLAARFERLGLPILIVPFNLTVPLVLYVMRQRVSDGGPHAVDFAPGTPEQNLAYFHSRRERFGAVRGVRLTAPFRGRWTCTQGVSGSVTHEGVWRHALDFEVLDADGRSFSGDGSSLEDCSCYRLPVTAPAAGVVARVIDAVPDNPVGEVNLDDNWGNVVIVYHAPGVYSCLAHLAPGSARVREGDAVAVGDVLALCGNSGRSATPHLHLQLQASADVGAATIPIELHDVVGPTASGELPTPPPRSAGATGSPCAPSSPCGFAPSTTSSAPSALPRRSR
nr:M23 family metallopeptidase [Deltaproteobacteria bacterium]